MHFAAEIEPQIDALNCEHTYTQTNSPEKHNGYRQTHTHIHPKTMKIHYPEWPKTTFALNVSKLPTNFLA